MSYLLNQNAKTEKGGALTLILGLELLPHRLPSILLRGASSADLGAVLDRVRKIADRWGAPATPRSGAVRRAAVPVGIALRDFADRLASNDHAAWSAVDAYSACPGSSEACRASCLVFSGFGTMPDTEAARLARTLAFLADRGAFLELLRAEIETAATASKRKGERLAVRLNVFSDHRWERIAPDLFTVPGVVFYDYTKLRPASRADRPAHYFLTQSWTDTDSAERLAERLAAGNLAVPFLIGKRGKLPTTWMGRPVINGDETDARFDDPAGVIVGLAVKGKAGSRPTDGPFGVAV